MHLMKYHITTIWLIATLLLLLTSRPVTAQASEHRLILGGDFGRQTATHSRLEMAEFELFLESGSFESSYHIASDKVLDGGGSVRLWRRLGAGIYFSRFKTTSTVRISAMVPHPFFFGFGRNATATVPALERQEIAVHLQAQYWLPAGERLLATFFFGPTFFNVKQDQISSIQTLEQGFPFDVVDITSHQRVSESRKAIGYNIGVDIVQFVLDHLGLAAQLRYSRGTAAIKLNHNWQPALELGGLHVLGGVRIGF